MKHTPGPWHAVKDADGDWDIESPSGWLAHTIRCTPIDDDDDDEEAAANARLIVAAPKLLAMCKLALSAFENNNAIDWGEIAAAIAEAE